MTIKLWKIGVHTQAFGKILFQVPTQSRPFKTDHFPSRLSPKNETGIPEFEATSKVKKKLCV